MTVAEAQARVTSSEFAEWQAYFQLAPPPEIRADLRSGVLASMLGAIFAREGQAPTPPAEFVLEHTGAPVVAAPPAAASPPTAVSPAEETAAVLRALGARRR